MSTGPRRRLIGLILLLIAGVSLSLTAGKGARSENKPADAILVRQQLQDVSKGIPTALEELGVGVLADYDEFTLVVADADVRGQLKRRGIEFKEIPDRTMVGMGAYRFDTKRGEPSIPEQLRAESLKHYDTQIVQFIGPVKAEWLDAIKSKGADVLMYLPPFSYVVTLERRDVDSVDELAQVQWVGPFHPAYKISDSLRGVKEEEPQISLSLFPGKDSEAVVTVIEKAGGAVAQRWVNGAQTWMRASVPQAIIEDLARMTEVRWIEAYMAPSFTNDRATWVSQSNITNSRTVHDRGLGGQNQLITLTDEGPDPSHPMFYDTNPIGSSHRKLQSCTAIASCYDPEDPPIPCGDWAGGGANGHGTNTAGVAAGDAGTLSAYDGHDGHAYRSRLVVQDIGPHAGCISPDPDLLYPPSYLAGSRIHTNSWGTIGGPSYCAGAVSIDQFTWDNPDYFVDFAFGNGGLSSMVCEATAKNVVAVGASDNGSAANNRATFSSRGPGGADGRRKPTLMAPGDHVCTAKKAGVGGNPACPSDPTNADYNEVDGTSFSAPAVAGNAALARQYFTEGWYPSGTKTSSATLSPSAALLRATLVSGAQEMTGETAYSGSLASVSAGVLKLSRTSVSIDDVTLRSESISLDYGQLYQLRVRLLVPMDITQNKVAIADDGRVTAQIIQGPQATKAKVEILGQSGSVGSFTINRNVTYILAVDYHSPSSGQFTADVTCASGGCGEPPESAVSSNFQSGTTGKIKLGADISQGEYGEVTVDSITYYQPALVEVFEELFDSSSLDQWEFAFPVIDDRGYPNNVQGWGRLHLDNALFFFGESPANPTRRLVAFDDTTGLTQGQVAVKKVNVTDSSQPLEVTLAWTDRPGTNPAHAIVNNLDLVVKDPDNVTYRGNCFAGRNPGQSVSTVAAPSCLADDDNVEEGFLRTAAGKTGLWTIEVTAATVQVGAPQKFALVATGGITPYPIGQLPNLMAEADYQTGPGTINAGSFTSTQISDDVSEELRESLSGTYQLTHIWRLNAIAWPRTYAMPLALHLEARRTSGGGMDGFQFAWAVADPNGVPGTFTDISGAIINNGFEPVGGADFNFTVPAGTYGPIFIRAKDRATGANQTSLFVDHMYVKSMPITFLMYPVADAGPNNGTAVPNVAHYLNVDEDPHDSDNTYIKFAAPGKEAFTTIDALQDTDIVQSVKVRWVAKKGTGNSWNARAGLVVSGTEYYGTTINLSTNYVVREETFTTNPNTGQAWTVAGLRAAKPIYDQVTTSQNLPTARLTELVLVVTVLR